MGMRSRIASVVLGVVLALGPALTAAGDPGKLALSIPVPAEQTGTLYVELDRGRVDVVPHDASEVRIEAQARGLGASSVHFQLRQDGNDVVLTGRGEEWLAWMQSGPSVRVRAWVPRRYTVEISTTIPTSSTRNITP